MSSKTCWRCLGFLVVRSKTHTQGKKPWRATVFLCLLQQTLHKIASDILHHLDAAIAMVETDNPAELAYLAGYRDDVERRCHHFQAQATLLPELQL